MFSLDSFGKQADFGRFGVNQHIICVNQAKFGRGLTIYIYILECAEKLCNTSVSAHFCFIQEELTMRFTIDTTLERIIVPDSFFNQIDKMNQVLAERGAADKKIDYVQYINEAIAKAQKNAPVRKSDVKTLK